MASQGPLFPGTVTTETGPSGDNDWTNASNVGANDGSEAQITAATYDAGDHSFRLRARNFGFTIPTGATIDGIVVEIERRDFAGDAQDQEVRLFDSTGTLVGDDKQTATSWPTTIAIATYGGAADDWNAGLDDADINSANFGVALIVLANSANTDIGVDFIRVTVHYTGGAVDVTVTPSPVTIPLVIPVPARVDVESPYEDLVESYLPVAYWVFAEGGGTTAYDERSGAHHATHEGSPFLAQPGIPAETQTSIEFDGDDWLTVPDHALFDFTGAFTLMVWAKHAGSFGGSGDMLMGKGSGAPMWWITSAGKFVLSKRDTADVVQGTDGDIADEEWHHLVAVYENGIEAELYIDGVAVGGTPNFQGMSATGTELSIGSQEPGTATNPWRGNLQHFAIFDYRLNATEVLDLYENGVPPEGTTVTPSPVTIPLVVPAPTVTAGRVLTPSPVAIPLVIPAPTVQAGRVVAPDPVALPMVVPAPTILVGATVTPDPVVVVLVIPDPTVTAEGGASPTVVTPDPVAIALALPSPAIAVGALVAVSPVAIPLVIVAPTLQIGKTVTPDPVALPLVIPAPAIQAGVIVTPSPVTLPLLVVAPAIAVGALVTPDPVTLLLALPALVVTAGGELPAGFLDGDVTIATIDGGTYVLGVDGGSYALEVESTAYALAIAIQSIELDIEE